MTMAQGLALRPIMPVLGSWGWKGGDASGGLCVRSTMPQARGLGLCREDHLCVQRHVPAGTPACLPPPPGTLWVKGHLQYPLPAPPDTGIHHLVQQALTRLPMGRGGQFSLGYHVQRQTKGIMSLH